MTPAEAGIVRSTFKTMSQEPAGLAAHFYGRMFELDPSLRSIFPTGLAGHGGKFLGMLETVVNGLDQPVALASLVRALGRRQRGYGLQPRHYAVVGQALLFTVAQSLGDKFTEEVSLAWADAYVLLAETMMAATYNHMDLVA